MGIGKEIIFLIIVIFLTVSSVLIPEVKNTFSEGYTSRNSYNSGQIESSSSENMPDIEDVTPTGIWKIGRILATIFLWSFGDIPKLLDLFIYVPIRLLGYYLLIDLLWIG